MHPLGTQALGSNARAVVDQYLSLPIGGKPSCPYFNNRRRQIRGGLRVLKGKGSPEEIAEECGLQALHARITIKDLSTDKLKEFLVDRNLGVDCSGFAYHVLDAILFETTGKRLGRTLVFRRPGFASKIITRLRHAENAGDATFRLDENSVAIKPTNIRPGDFITFIGTGKDKTYNHILVVVKVDRNIGSESDMLITYAHSYAWPSDGIYGHGVREGDILIKNNDLLESIWKEQGITGIENYTYASALNANEISVRRLKGMS